MVSGGFRPTASQNDPMTVSPNGGNGQSGRFVAQKVAKATQLRPSGFAQGENLGAISPLDAEPDTYLPATDGVDFGSGRGSEALPPSINPNNRQIENVDLVKRYLPDLLNAARMPGAPDSYKRMVNALMRELM